MNPSSPPAPSAGRSSHQDDDFHPPRRWAVRYVVPILVVLTAGSLLFVAARDVLSPATPVHVRPVVFDRTATPVSSDGVAAVPSVQAPGWLEADPFYTACTALTDGVVAEVLALEGEPVEAGQVVARLVDDDARLAVATAEAEIAAAEAMVLLAEANVTAARTNWDHPIERDRAVGVTLAYLAGTEAELVQLPSLVAVEQANVERLREELARARHAFEREAASDLEVIILEKKVDAQVATTEATRRREAILVAQRDRLRADVTAANLHADLRVAERRALDVALAQTQQARATVARMQAKLDEAQLRLDRMVIKAPITGLVQRRFKVPGDKIMLGMDMVNSAHVLHLYDPRKLQVRVDVPLADAAHVRVGQRCEVIVDILPDETFAGEVTRITHEADLQKNTLQVKVRVIDPSPLLKPEMLTRVKFLGNGGDVSQADDPSAPTTATVLVPVQCLDRDDSGNARVWTIRDRRGQRGTCTSQAVTITEETDGWATVSGALTPGDLLAVVGPQLRTGQRVRMLAPSSSEGSL